MDNLNVSSCCYKDDSNESTYKIFKNIFFHGDVHIFPFPDYKLVKSDSDSITMKNCGNSIKLFVKSLYKYYQSDFEIEELSADFLCEAMGIVDKPIIIKYNDFIHVQKGDSSNYSFFDDSAPKCPKVQSLKYTDKKIHIIDENVTGLVCGNYEYFKLNEFEFIIYDASHYVIKYNDDIIYALIDESNSLQSGDWYTKVYYFEDSGIILVENRGDVSSCVIITTKHLIKDNYRKVINVKKAH